MPERLPEELRTHRLVLTPLAVADAEEMVGVLADPSLYVYTGGTPPPIEELTSRYRSQVAGSGRASETWYNWVVRLGESGIAIGLVQATVELENVDLAWVVGEPWQGNGYATEAAVAMRSWLAESGLRRFCAHVHPHHVASQRVATYIGLQATGQLDGDGEEAWVAEPNSRTDPI